MVAEARVFSICVRRSACCAASRSLARACAINHIGTKPARKAANTAVAHTPKRCTRALFAGNGSLFSILAPSRDGRVPVILNGSQMLRSRARTGLTGPLIVAKAKAHFGTPAGNGYDTLRGKRFPTTAAIASDSTHPRMHT